MIPIAKLGQKITGAAPETKTYLDPDFPLAMSATSGLDVVFFASGDCTVDGSTIEVAFSLPGGAYATAIMREVMKDPAQRVDDTPEAA
jgi:tRNA(Glu) U13 pseudouridine synthase TruD